MEPSHFTQEGINTVLKLQDKTTDSLIAKGLIADSSVPCECKITGHENSGTGNEYGNICKMDED